MLPKFLSSDLWKKSTDDNLMREINVLDRLSMVSGMHWYFVMGQAKLKEKLESQNAKLACAVEQFHAECKDWFQSLSCIRVDGVIRISPFQQLADECMLVFGRQCACKLAYPFSMGNRVNNADFVVDVVQSFESVYTRLLPLWSTTQAHHLSKTFGVLLHELMVLWPKEDEDAHSSGLRLSVVSLVFESLAMGEYLDGFLSLGRANRNSANHPIVRSLFWAISFLYARIDPQWDRKGGISIPVLDAYIERTEGVELRSRFFGVAVAAVERLHLTDVSVQNLRRYIADELTSPIDQAIVQRAIDAMMGCGVARFYPDADAMAALNVHILQAEVMLLAGESPMPCCAPNVSGARVGSNRARSRQSAAVTVQQAQHRSEASSFIDAGMESVFQETGDSVVAPGRAMIAGMLLGDEDVLGDEDESLKKKKLSQSQRRKLAKRREEEAERLREEERVVECSAFLSELCDQVAQDAVRESIRLEEQRRATAETLTLGFISDAIQIIAREMVEAALEDFKAAEGLKAQQLVLQQLRGGKVSDDFKCQLLIELMPGSHKFLQGDWECIICMKDLDSEKAETVRYRPCCNGGVFLCEQCFDENPCPGHEEDKHSHKAEILSAVQAASFRRAYGLVKP
jgi:hypothetical protein